MLPVTESLSESAYTKQYLLWRVPQKSEVVCLMRFFITEKHGQWKLGVKEGGSKKRGEMEILRQEEGERR